MSVAPTAKTNLVTTLDAYRAKAGEFRILTVPPQRYFAVDGAGDPNTSSEFTAAVETLYPAAYALKFASKAAGRDYVVPPLEGLWWADDMDSFTRMRDKSTWSWTLLLLIPDWVEQPLIDAALAKAATRKVAARKAATERPPSIERRRILNLDEGLCVQTLHVGSFDDEGPVLERMHGEAIPAQGLRMTGRHHEIYLSDTRRTPPERQRTILRQPVVRVGEA